MIHREVIAAMEFSHLGLQKETPGRRVRAAARGGVTALPRLGGLHDRYERVA